MKTGKDEAIRGDALRRQAERKLGRSPDRQTPPMAEADVRKQLHELQVSQIELEMQNAELTELQRAQQELRDVLARYTELYDFAPVGYMTLDQYGTLHKINLTGAALLGRVRTKLAGRRLSKFIAPASHLTFHAFLNRVFAGHGSEACEVALVTPDRRPLHVHIDAHADASGETCHAAMLDVTERKLAEDSMRLASLVYQNCSEAMAVTDANGAFLSVNPAFTEITGYRQDEVIGKDFGMLRADRQQPMQYRIMLETAGASGGWKGEAWMLRKSGDMRICWFNINAVCSEDHAAHRYVALFSDITKRKNAEVLVWKQANFDGLTGLPNRSMLLDHLDQEIRKSHRAGLPLALLFFDLDHFKDVNDTLGHATGDRLLQEAAQRLRECVRDTDTVARLGGDEFTIVMGQLDDLGAVERVAGAVLSKLAQPFYLAGAELHVSASIGITLYPADAVDIDSLLKNADQAMYAAKNQGRNRFHYFTPAMQNAALARMRLINDLRNALAGNEFELFYQPIVDMTSGTIDKAEALLRWRHPARGLILPAEFIPTAEDIGIIADIGNWVFREAGRCAAHWRAAHREAFQVSVNMSPVQFLSRPAPGHVQGLAAGLAVEITEGLLLDASTAVTDQLIALRDAGVQVALDDFGTGYSSLSYLKKFDIDYIKIDQSFVHNLAADSDDMALCEAIIVMAHKLGLKVISEGIETELQHQLLADVGCDYGQGYLYSKAVPVAEFEELLSAGSLH